MAIPKDLRERRAAVLLLDGARPDVVQALVAQGDMPNLSRYVLESGSLSPMTTVLPSTTGPAYLPFLTGCFPGTCNVPGIRWLDPAAYCGQWWRDRDAVRSYCGYQGNRLDADVLPWVASVFELEPDAVAICSPFTRGLAPSRARARFARALLGTAAHFTSRYRSLDRAAGRQLIAAARARTRFVFAAFPGIDGVTHFEDPLHPHVLRLYRDFDDLLGAYAAAGGFDGEHLTVVVSDHGLSPVAHHTDLALAFERRGLPTLRHPLLWRSRPQLAVMVSGNSAAHVYLRPGKARFLRYGIGAIEAGEVAGIPRNLIDQILELPGIALVAGTDGRDVIVCSPTGRARLEAEHDAISYIPTLGDPLFLGGEKTQTSREWLLATYRGRYPDAPTQLLQLFRSPRSGDLVVFAAPGHDLRRRWEIPAHRSGHGSLHAEHMRSVFATNTVVPGPLRSADVFPLVVRFLGHAVPAGIDGCHPMHVPSGSTKQARTADATAGVV